MEFFTTIYLVIAFGYFCRGSVNSIRCLDEHAVKAAYDKSNEEVSVFPSFMFQVILSLLWPIKSQILENAYRKNYDIKEYQIGYQEGLKLFKSCF